MLHKKTIEDINVKGKRVIVRVDFNVPLDNNGEILNDRRIVAALPTLRYLISQDARIILISHLEGHMNGRVKQHSIKPTAIRLSELTECEVIIALDTIGKDAKRKVASLQNGQILMLENLRFHEEETSKDPKLRMVFAKELASMGEVYILDAFATAHRAHSSIIEITNFLPSVCGFLIKREMELIREALVNPQRPLVVVLDSVDTRLTIEVKHAII